MSIKSILFCLASCVFLMSCGDDNESASSINVQSSIVCNPFAASAQTSVPSAGYEVVGGVWQVYSEQGLIAFRDHVNGIAVVAGATNDVVLMNDITLTTTWTPIGGVSNPYVGTFDGNSKNIHGLSITSTSDYQGLFGNVGGSATISTTIKNVAIIGANISAVNYTGTVAGRLGSNVAVDNARAVGGKVAVRGDALHVGGIAGFSYATIIENSCNSNTIDAEGVRIMAGGIVGSNYGNLIKLSNNTGIINGSGDNTRAGGVVGYNQVGVVLGCAHSMAFVGGANEVGGGVVGANGGEVIASYNIGGSVTGGFSAGAVVGYNYGKVTSCYSVPGTIIGLRSANGAIPGAIVGSNNYDSSVIEGTSLYVQNGSISGFGTGAKGTATSVNSIAELNSKISLMNNDIPQNSGVVYFEGAPDKSLNPPVVR